MDDYCEVIEYGPEGQVLSQGEVELVDRARRAGDLLEAATGARTGRLAYEDITHGRGPFVWGRFRGRTGPWPLAIVWLRETEEPWRIAWGLALRGRKSTYVAALGRRSDPPEDAVLMTASEPTDWNVAPGALVHR